MATEDRYVFTVEWYDSAASLTRSYNLTYFIRDKTIEMVIKMLLVHILTFSSST